MSTKEAKLHKKASDKHKKEIAELTKRLGEIISDFPKRGRCCATAAIMDAILSQTDQGMHQALGALLHVAVIQAVPQPNVNIIDMTEVVKQASKHAQRQKPKKDNSQMVV